LLTSIDGTTIALVPPLDIAMAFVSGINAHDVDGICELMTDDHVFVDALGTRFVGKEAMRSGWREFLRLFPRYRIEVAETTHTGAVVGLFGAASGSFLNAPRESWRVTAAWKAKVVGGRIAERWDYCDTAWVRRAR